MAGTLICGDSVAWQLAGVRDQFGLTELAEQMGQGGPSPFGLQSKGFVVTNVAVPGTGPARDDILNPVTWADTHYLGTFIDQYHPNKVVISFGGNTDVWDNDFSGTEPRNTTRWQMLSIAGYQDIIGDARSRMNDRDIVLVAGWQVGPSDQGPDWDTSLNWFGQYVIANIQPTLPNVRWVNVLDIAGNNSRYRLSDNIHLTDDGVSMVADRIAAQLAFDSTSGGGTGPTTPTLPVVLPPEQPLQVFTVSERFKEEINESHTVVNRLQVRRLDLDDVMAELPISDGSMTCSSADATHRSLDVTVLTDADGFPLEPGTDLLNPFFTEVQLWSGVRYANGLEELLPCGVFKITDYSCVTSNDGRVHKLACYDRSIRARGKLGNAVVTPAGTSIEDAAARLIRLMQPTAKIHFPQTGFITPNIIHAETSTAWGEASKLFSSSGYVLSTTRDGVYVATPTVTAPNTVAPDWLMVEDERDPAWNVNRKAKVAPNHVIVNSSSTQTHVQGEAFDADPGSRTYVGGPYGDVIENITDERVTTVEQANRAATQQLVRFLAGTEDDSASCLPNPAMDLDQTVLLNRTSASLNAYVLVDEYKLPLQGDKEMTVTFRPGVHTQFDPVQNAIFEGSAQTTRIGVIVTTPYFPIARPASTTMFIRQNQVSAHSP